MQDRVATYPGRVKLTPVSGQANTYDMERADSPTEQGTALNKANLLSDTTASLLGLTNPTVNDYLANIINGGFKGFWWKKSNYSVITTNYTNDSLETRVTQSATANNNSTNTHTIYYTDDFEIDGATFKPIGTIQSISGTFSYIGSNISTLKNKYAWLTSSGEPQSTLIKMTENTSYVFNEYDRAISKYVGCANYAIKYSFEKSLVDYVCSSNIGTYPINEFADDGYYYELLKSLVTESLYKIKKQENAYSYTTTEYTTSETATIYKHSANNTDNDTVYYADSFSIDDNGYYILQNYNTVSMGYSDTTIAQGLRGKYKISNTYRATSMDYIPINANFASSWNGTYWEMYCTPLTQYNPPYHRVVEILTRINDELVGTNDGTYFYTLDERVNVGSTRVAYGQYIGTGIYGSSNTSSLTFSFEPKIVFILDSSGILFGSNYSFLAINPMSQINTYSNYECKIEWNDKTMNYYSTNNANAQMNGSGQLYYWFAIG